MSQFEEVRELVNKLCKEGDIFVPVVVLKDIKGRDVGYISMEFLQTLLNNFDQNLL